MARPPALDPLPPLAALASPEETLTVHAAPRASLARVVPRETPGTQPEVSMQRVMPSDTRCSGSQLSGSRSGKKFQVTKVVRFRGDRAARRNRGLREARR
jgi:hypothetical protein